MVRSKSRHSRARKKSQRRTCKPGRKDAEALMREAEAEEAAPLSAAFEPVCSFEVFVSHPRGEHLKCLKFKKALVTAIAFDPIKLLN